MRMLVSLLAVAAVVHSTVAVGEDGASKAQRIFRSPRHVRGNTGVMQVQPIDQAVWIAPSNGVWNGKAPRVARGHVQTPVAGTFVYGNQILTLKPGDNTIAANHFSSRLSFCKPTSL